MIKGDDVVDAPKTVVITDQKSSLADDGKPAVIQQSNVLRNLQIEKRSKTEKIASSLSKDKEVIRERDGAPVGAADSAEAPVMVTIQIKIPQEQVPDLQLAYELEYIMSIQDPLRVEDLKRKIQASHPFKPDIKRQRLLFGGKLLDNSEHLRTIL